MIKSRAIAIILYALGLSLLIGLSIWQYERGVNKQIIEKKRGDLSFAQIGSSPDDWSEFSFRDAQLRGQWLSPSKLQWQSQPAFLLENKIFEGQVGYEVLMPFALEGDASVLMVNRGWIPMLSLPDLNVPSEQTQVQGVVYQPEKGLEIGDAILPAKLKENIWPKKSLYLDLALFSQALKSPLEPAVLVLDQKDPASFQRVWKAVVMTSAKHFGYAVQWLGLAITFMVYGVIWFRRKNKTHIHSD